MNNDILNIDYKDDHRLLVLSLSYLWSVFAYEWDCVLQSKLR
jgi:hypothetical protein